MTNQDLQFLDQAKSELFQYDQWRIKFLNVILRVLCALGLLLIGAIIPSASSGELFLFGAVYVALLAATFAPLPYAVKAGVLLAVGYFISVFTLIRFGPWSDAAVFMLASTIFAGLLFDEQVDRWLLTLNVITLAGVGTLNAIGRFALSANVPITNGFGWLTYSADYIVLAIALMWAVNLLKSEFRTVADQFQSALKFLSKDRNELEQRIDDRTTGLVKRTDQLRAASYIARQTAEAENLEDLLETVVKLVTDQFGFYHAGIFLINETGDEAILQAASSDGGKRMIEKGHSLKVGSQGIVGYVAAQKRSHIALDVGTDAVFFNNPDLPRTRSEMALPLTVHNRILGILDIQSDQPQAFNTDDTDVLQTLADQVAVAIENARLLDEAQAALLQIEALTAVRTREAWGQVLKQGGYSYTFTPLGLRAGNASNHQDDKALKIPITLRGQKIGTITLSKKDETPWNKIDEELVNEVAYQAGLAVDNIRLLEDATQRARQEQTVGELAARFSQSLDIDSLLQTAARELGQVPEVAEISVFIGQIPEQAPQKRRSRRISGQ